MKMLASIVAAAAAAAAMPEVLTASASASGWMATNDNRPNIIWIMADDMGWGEPGLYPSTSQHGRISTPNLDEFGRSGMRFTNAYAGYTVCAPSRTTLMTGYHSGHFPALGLDGQNIAPSFNGTLLLPQLLSNNGYATAGIGKLAPLTNPARSGFDFFIGQVDQGLCHNMYPRTIDSGNFTNNVDLPGNHHIPPVDSTNNFSAARAYCMDPTNQANLNYTVDITHAYAMDWIANEGGTMRDPAKPFFLYESFTVPHAGGWGWQGSPGGTQMENGAPVPTDGQYGNKSSWPEVERDHAATITYLDAYIGELMHQIDIHGLTANTIVFFASDNGAHLEGGHDYRFFNSTGGLLGHKRSLFEGGVRSPTMVRWPGRISAGTTSDYAWAFWDIVPTLADLAGAETPRGLDGESILPTLMGHKQPAKEYLVWTWRGTGMSADVQANLNGVTLHQDPTGLEYFRNRDGKMIEFHESEVAPSGYALRSGEWKIVVPHCDSSQKASTNDSAMVFHLPSDPFETTNLNNTDTGNAQRVVLVDLAVKHNVTCNCFQC
eukprot:INCI14358.1.p1 GENE.INCI14358.1~~INCI14358.1.p1  ORF type:complete len:547 (+),score=70.63 INCI14358.1:71-1711(+)